MARVGRLHKGDSAVPLQGARESALANGESPHHWDSTQEGRHTLAQTGRDAVILRRRWRSSNVTGLS